MAVMPQDKEQAKIWRTYSDAPCLTPRHKRKMKLKLTFKGRMAEEIRRTEEKLELLRELWDVGHS